MAFWTKPTDNTPGWDSNVETKTEPTPTEKNNGWANEEVPDYANFNWLFYSISTFITWIVAQLTICGTTQSVDNPAAGVQSVVDTYISSLPKHINHDITIKLDDTGATFSGTTITLTGYHGSGILTIDGDGMIAGATDDLDQVVIVDCSCPIVITDIPFTGATEGVSVENGSNVTILDCSFDTTGGATVSGKSRVVFSNCDTWTSPTFCVDASEDAHVEILGNCDLTTAFSADPIQISGNAIVNVDPSLLYISANSPGFAINDTVVCTEGGIYLSGAGMGGSNSITGVTIQKSLDDATGINNFDNVIRSFQKHIPFGTTYQIYLNHTAADPHWMKIEGFTGGGTLEVYGNGVATTQLIGDPSVEISNCSCHVHLHDFYLSGSSSVPSQITISNCSGKIELESVDLHSSYSGQTTYKAITVESSPNVMITTSDVISDNDRVYQDHLYMYDGAKVFANNNTYTTNKANAYGANVLQGSELRWLSSLYDGNTAQTNSDASSTITGA